MVDRSEKAILNSTLVEVSALPGVMAWRNNTGMAWQGEKRNARVGQMVRVESGMVILAEARPIIFGLPGSGDILGAQMLDADDIRALLARHGGETRIGQFFALEGKKRTGRQEETQRKFQAAFERAGGLYGIFRSEDEALQILARGR